MGVPGLHSLRAAQSRSEAKWKGSHCCVFHEVQWCPAKLGMRELEVHAVQRAGRRTPRATVLIEAKERATQ